MGKPESRYETVSDEALLLEAAHRRHAVEFSNVLGILHLVRAGLREPHPLVEDAIDRVECQLHLERLLLAPPILDLSMVLAATCELIARSRSTGTRFTLRADACPVASIALSRAFMLISFEAVTLIATGIAKSDSPVALRLRVADGIVTLIVRHASTSQEQVADIDRVSLATLRQIVSRLDGRLAFARGRKSRTLRVRIPLRR
ncbi:hypothetical protein K3175_10500 [Qipengyuania sp. GH1]|uniref:hypothetical protein n=1 Tax=Qipengyuania aestuarii TaxID=2867241 RepID=UPI001C867946|nr:hypothetical protein [Qipengyuania aestuarii]MBX7536089.1 hypothetical protein [Qipengyuania aestuarii]